VDSKPVRSLLRQHQGRSRAGTLIKAAEPHPARGRLEGDLDNLFPPLYLDGRGLSVEDVDSDEYRPVCDSGGDDGAVHGRRDDTITFALVQQGCFRELDLVLDQIEIP
jgi:hypothetical protein